MGIFKKIFSGKHERDSKKIIPLVEIINKLCDEFDSLGPDDFPKKTLEFKQRITEAISAVRNDMKNEKPEDIEQAVLEEEEDILDDILPEAYALVKQACKQHVGKRWNVRGIPTQWDMVPYDVQIVGAVILHRGNIAEMATGEGKTLAATMPLYLNALTGRGVHLVTVNDYLAARDSEWMGEIYKYLGLTIGCILNTMISQERRDVYACDITYGTNNEFGFDYLRDNMAVRPEDQVQRKHSYAIVDEVDSVLIDEARTPLIISGPVAVSTQLYDKLNPLVVRTVKAQSVFVSRLIMESEKLLEEGKDYEAGVKILQAYRGGPKNKRLTKLLNEQGIRRLMQSVENDFIRDKKINELEEELYYSIDEKRHIADLTEKGRQHMAPTNPEMFVLPDISEEIHDIDTNDSFNDDEKARKKEEIQETYNQRSEQNHNISQLFRAYSLYEKDDEYVVQDGKVMIVDEFTGRLLPGRRYSDGLHQALEAKENVKIERESQTLATITLQNYFRLYNKLAGMTGTAVTEENEFWEIYKLECKVIPPNKPVARDNYDDRIYRTKLEKYTAVIAEIEEMISKGRPVLVGTVSVDVSETLSRMLKRMGIRHSVLNAKQHQQEAEIVANAGRPGSVTIATNMAGRGTDIKLGQGVKDSGGLHIIGTERHDARRIDLQLRGRCSRQGDLGSSRFFLSLEDDLMRLFGSDRIARVMDRLGASDGEVIQHPMITRSIERAQKKVEGHNFSIRKHLLEYDDVMNKQREVIYEKRNSALQGDNLKDEILQMVDEFIEDTVDEYADKNTYFEDWDWDGLQNALLRSMLLNVDVAVNRKEEPKQEELEEKLKSAARTLYYNKEQVLGSDIMRRLERVAVLKVIDEQWKDNLYELDQLKEGVSLRAYGQKDPLIEYKREAFSNFQEMLAKITQEALSFIFKARLETAERPQIQSPQRMTMRHDNASGLGYQQAPEMREAARRGRKEPVRVDNKVGRNAPCPCGSGKKYKKCHGKSD